MSTTLSDIARATQTSVSTVSRALSGSVAANRLNLDTRQRIQAAAQELGYRPNLNARTLRTQRSNSIGLIVNDITDPLVARIGNLIEQHLLLHGYSLMICNSNEDSEQEARHLWQLDQRGIDGLIIAPVSSDVEQLRQNLSATLPMVILNRSIAGLDATVAGDHEQTATLLCQTLRQAGVQRVAVVSGSSRLSIHRIRMQVVRQNFDVLALHEGPAIRKTGRDARAVFARLPIAPEAIICSGLVFANGIMQVTTVADLQNNPPALGVFDWVPMQHLLPVPIAAAVQDVYELAEGCVEQLMPMLSEPVPGAAAQRRPQEPLIFAGQIKLNPAYEAWADRRLAVQ